MKRLALLGSTGSIGEQTLAVVAEFPARYRVTALAAGQKIDKLADQVRRFRPELVAVADAAGADALRARLGGEAPRIEVGAPGLVAVAEARRTASSLDWSARSASRRRSQRFARGATSRSPTRK